MARVTTEDCIDKVNSHFELIVIATQRARELSNGALPTVERHNDKNSIIALREIAEQTQSVEDLRERTIKSFQSQIEAADEDDKDHASNLLVSEDNDQGDLSTQSASADDDKETTDGDTESDNDDDKMHAILKSVQDND